MARRASVTQARALRRRQTATERVLWRGLRDRRLAGLKFRRQVPPGPYVVDFLCLSHRLVLEADGPFHDPTGDAARDAWLSAHGFRVLRIRNHEAQDPDQVAARILEIIEHAPPSPPAGEGVGAADG